MCLFSVSFARVRRSAISFVLVTQLLVVIGCTGNEGADAESGFASQAEAVELWVESDEAPLPTSRSADLKAETRSVVWLAVQGSGGLFRIDPTRGDYRLMGVADDPPAEIDQPARVAVSPEHGLFVFDLPSGRVDQFTPDGIPVHSFVPGFFPSRMDVVQRPISLQFAVMDTDRSDSIPRLVIIRTDLRGEQPDTVLLPGTYGPETLWEAVAIPGQLALDASATGMWAWGGVAADTVFEITSSPKGRKRVLRPQDQNPLGILVDGPREILWVVSADQSDNLRYSAYDIRAPGLTEPEDSYLGERTTTGFDPKVAEDGVVIGRVLSGTSGMRLAAYDMLVPLNR